MDLFVRMTGAITALDIAENEELYLPVTGVWYLLTGHDPPEQSGYSYLESRKVGE